MDGNMTTETRSEIFRTLQQMSLTNEQLQKLLRHAQNEAQQDEADVKSLALAPTLKPVRGFVFQKLPSEIRIMIYRLLLIRDWLSKGMTRPRNSQPVDTAILLTCSDISREAAKILYEENTFMVRETALSRLQTRIEIGSPQFQMVQKWILFFYQHDVMVDEYASRMARFCQTLSKAPEIRSLELRFRTRYRPFPPNGPREIPPLSPFEILRNIKEVRFTHVEWYSRRNNPCEIGPKEEILIKLITGNTPVENVFKMHQRLLQYAQAFEENLMFAVRMDHPRDGKWSPFKISKHSAESYLLKALRSSNLNEGGIFRGYRAKVLEIFENQYKDLILARKNIFDHLKSLPYKKCQFNEKWNWPFLKAPLCKSRRDQFCLLIHRYDTAFERDMPEDVEAHIRANQKRWDACYASTLRKRTMREFHNVLLMDDSDAHGHEVRSSHPLCRTFRNTLMTLEAEFAQIHRARMELFADDLGGNRGYDFLEYAEEKAVEDAVHELEKGESDEEEYNARRFRRSLDRYYEEDGEDESFNSEVYEGHFFVDHGDESYDDYDHPMYPTGPHHLVSEQYMDYMFSIE